MCFANVPTYLPRYLGIYTTVAPPLGTPYRFLLENLRPHLTQPDKKQGKIGKRLASLLQSRFRLEIFLIRSSARPTRPVSCNRRSSFNSKRHHYSFFSSETPTIRFSHSVLGLPLSKA